MHHIVTFVLRPLSAFTCALVTGMVCTGVFCHTASLAAGYVELSPFEHAVIEEMNRARGDPRGYSRFLEQLRPYYVGNLFRPPSGTPVSTVEGVAAVNDAIRFLRTVRPAPSVRLSRGMSLGAMAHV